MFAAFLAIEDFSVPWSDTVAKVHFPNAKSQPVFFVAVVLIDISYIAREFLLIEVHQSHGG